MTLTINREGDASAGILVLPATPAVISAPPDTSPPAIELSRVGLRLGRSQLLHDLSFRVPYGAILGLLAPSGGGKTTTLRLMTGVYTPASGMVRVFGGAPSRFSLAGRRRIGYMPQSFVLYPELSVRRNMEFMAGIYGLPRRGRAERIDELLRMVELGDVRDRPAGRLSGGMQRRLQLAATLLHDPDLLIIDEPTAGIDPILRARFWDHFHDLRAAGRTLVVSTQYVTEAEHCDLVVMLRNGRVVAAGTPAALREQAFGPGAALAGSQSPTFEDVFLRLVVRADEGERAR